MYFSFHADKMNSNTFISRNRQNRSSTQSPVQYSLGEILQASYLAKGNQLPNIQKRLYDKHFLKNPEEGNGLSIISITSQKKFNSLKHLDNREVKLYMPDRKSYEVESPEIRKVGRIQRRVTHSRKISATKLLAPINFTPVKTQKKVIQAKSEISLALKKQQLLIHTAEKHSLEISYPARLESYNSQSSNELRIDRFPVSVDNTMKLNTVVRKRKIQTPSEDDVYCVKNIAANNDMTSFADLLDLPSRPEKTYEYMKVFDQVMHDNSKRPKSRIVSMKPN